MEMPFLIDLINYILLIFRQKFKSFLIIKSALLHALIPIQQEIDFIMNYY